MKVMDKSKNLTIIAYHGNMTYVFTTLAVEHNGQKCYCYKLFMGVGKIIIN